MLSASAMMCLKGCGWRGLVGLACDCNYQFDSAVISLSCNTGLCSVGSKFNVNEHSCADNYQFNSTVISLSCNICLCSVGSNFYVNEHSCADNCQFNSTVDCQSVRQHWLIRCW